MGLISPADQERLREDFAKLTRPVRLLFFTQAVGCETCHITRQVLDELPLLSDKITIEEVNFVLEAETARQYGIDRVPAIAVAYVDGEEAEGLADPVSRHAGRLRVHLPDPGRPARRRRPSIRSLRGRPRPSGAGCDRPMTLQVFTTPT